MKRLLISGYYGFNNAGDEAVLLAILQALRTRCASWQPVVLSADPASTTRLYGVEAHQRWNRYEVWHEVRRCDALISGGGSLLQDVTGRASLLYYLGLIWLAKLCGKPVFIYAQGLGPLIGTGSRLLVRHTLNRVDRIVLRDAASAQFLASLGVARPAAVTADPVFALDVAALADREAADAVLRQAGVEPGCGPLALVSLRDLPGNASGRQPKLERAAAALARALAARGWQVFGLPLQWPQDVAVLRRAGSLTLPGRALDLREILGLFSLADLAVGMRLHALIFAALFARPLVGISYDPKVAAFLEQIGGPGLRPEDLTGEALLAAATGAWERRVRWAEELPPRLEPLRSQASRTADYLYELLEGNPVADT